jgi:hypothetical protein
MVLPPDMALALSRSAVELENLEKIAVFSFFRVTEMYFQPECNGVNRSPFFGDRFPVFAKIDRPANIGRDFQE